MRVHLSAFLLYTLTAGTCAWGLSNHYVDCANGNDAADSLTPATAWRTLREGQLVHLSAGRQPSSSTRHPL